ncbi:MULTISPECIES: YjcZ family sporulation protein [Lysinibacillus]|uniref:YjcZ family sporulation protein n=1 Tax=Lysinibacillus sphaericus TaxID=1421 RepID=A0A544U4G5_LYSSH|nr:YjcZ family sporulation protein [Lysinibacillus sp. SDF0037]TQR25632.1 YjcZ family sporulation protein [Lysinibacillus sp. SDF0037]
MGYYGGNVGGINNCGNSGGGYGNGSAFALIVVLFILLIIVGATFMMNTGY